MQKVLLTGGTGFIGREVGKQLVRAGYNVTVVSRDRKKAESILPFPANIIECDLTRQPLAETQQFDLVIHLMGENIAEGRWSEKKKIEMRKSRVAATQNLIKSVHTRVFVSTSAVGFYGDRGNEVLNENSAPGTDFLALLCQEWERSALAYPESVRTVILRFGVVVAPFGGALAKMIPLFKSGAGGRLATGEQWMSWIHIQDLVRLIMEAAKNDKYRGILNACSPEPVTNIDWTNRLVHQLGVYKGPPVPAVALRLALGEVSESIVASVRVLPEKASSLGFQFDFPKLKEAFQDVCAVHREGEAFHSEQYLPDPPEEVFQFFAEAKNLERITPEFLNFHIVKMSTSQIGQGTLIDYKLKLRGFPITWQTQIEEWNPPHRFVDNQLKGPYNKWHHTHLFEKMASGTLMTDIVSYRLPMGFFGRLAAGPMVAGDVEKIFAFRRSAVGQLAHR